MIPDIFAGPISVQYLSFWAMPGTRPIFKMASRQRMFFFAFKRKGRRVELAVRYDINGDLEVLESQSLATADLATVAAALDVSVDEVTQAVFVASLFVDDANREFSTDVP